MGGVGSVGGMPLRVHWSKCFRRRSTFFGVGQIVFGVGQIFFGVGEIVFGVGQFFLAWVKNGCGSKCLLP